MNESAVRQLAQSDPVPNLTDHWARMATSCKAHIEDLTACLRRLDTHAEALAEHGIVVTVDLGPIGNAAAAARRDLEKRSDRPQFEMPR